jgi:hypothetical protein
VVLQPAHGDLASGRDIGSTKINRHAGYSGRRAQNARRCNDVVRGMISGSPSFSGTDRLSWPHWRGPDPPTTWLSGIWSIIAKLHAFGAAVCCSPAHRRSCTEDVKLAHQFAAL